MHPFSYCDISVYGFHGCNQNIKRQLITKEIQFECSTNRYDWLPIENAPHPLGIGNPSDLVLRYLDKIVIENAILLAGLQEPDIIYDTVRVPFQEGFPVYPGSAFREHDHIHLCVRNPDLLTDLFDPEK